MQKNLKIAKLENDAKSHDADATAEGKINALNLKLSQHKVALKKANRAAESFKEQEMNRALLPDQENVKLMEKIKRLEEKRNFELARFSKTLKDLNVQKMAAKIDRLENENHAQKRTIEALKVKVDEFETIDGEIDDEVKKTQIRLAGGKRTKFVDTATAFVDKKAKQSSDNLN